MLITKAVVAAKLETVEGTPVATLAADAMFQARNIKIEPGIEMFERNVRRGTFSKFPSIPGKRMGSISFEIDLYGTPSAGVAPAWAILLKIAGFKEAASGNALTYTTSSVWNPSDLSTSDHKCATMGVYEDGWWQRLYGVRGAFNIVGEAAKPLALTFNGMGVIDDVADVAMLDPTYDAFAKVPPKFAGVGLSIGGLSASEAIFSRIEIESGNVVAMQVDANAEPGYRSAYIGDRSPTFKINPNALLIAQGHDFWATWKAGTTAVLACVVGTTLNKVSFGAPALQYQNVQPGERDDLRTREIEAKLCGSSDHGDDEFVITLGSV